VSGNVVVGNERVTKDNWDGGVQIENGDPNVVIPKVRVDRPFPMAELQLQTAAEAYEVVLANSGATLPKRDVVDRRIVECVQKGSVSPDTKQGIITDVKQVGGYPEYKGEPVKDTDGDGIPDWWETKYGLDPNDPSDAAKDCNGDGYTNIEKYINGIDPTTKIDWKDLRNNRDTLPRGR
jgi:hypothetical protein